MRARLLLLAGALLAGCSADPAAAPAPTSSASSTPAPPSTLAPGEACPVTHPSVFRPPDGVAPGSLFGSATSHGNGTLWVGALGPDGVITAAPDFVEADGAIGWKLGWWRAGRGRLTITGHRLDAAAPPLRADVPDGYGDTGFQASGVYFPAEGCWAVTGDIGTDPLTFVTLVRKLSP
ncbi:MAG TPA: hypothetical protein VGX25_04990 [Actinophytocola sp.]|uniref:hypothetical protein n=1 Tax=Actinophytocola sp. TaxID=1872138 RepID=UPI002DDD2162|nr:hypothetical protein [Actinophytocola sp.]HEV2778737.1 hypothetical protein [Actinophytocola sp.]